MIKIENLEVTGWEPAIGGMRNPMNSWNKSDSDWGCCLGFCRNCEEIIHCMEPRSDYRIGENDKKLMMHLAKAGAEHAKYRRMIAVYVDITAPLYWWKEFDTYKVGTVANSCSTMHKITAKPFCREDFSCEHMIGATLEVFDVTIDMLNEMRDCYNKWSKTGAMPDYLGDDVKGEFADKKDVWWQIIQLLPSSYNQKRTIMLNYEVLANIYRQRKDHKLDEWREFCKWIESLPYSEIITLKEATE